MGKLIQLNNITRIDLPVDQILESALGKLKHVVVLGYDKDGIEYFTLLFEDCRHFRRL